MSIESLMIHTCSIVRDLPSGEDALGNPIKQISIAVYSGICRLVERQERVWSDERGTAAKVTSYKLLIPCGASVQERDRIERVTLEDGSTLESYFAAKSALVRRSNRASHLSIDLERAA